MIGKVEVFEASNGEWHWHVKDANNEIVAHGEGYSRKGDAIEGFENAAHEMAKVLCSKKYREEFGR